MKPYIVLAGDVYYPSGWDDYVGDADELEEAVALGERYNGHLGWYEVVDLRTRKMVARGCGGKKDEVVHS
jgi:hypothetical protein